MKYREALSLYSTTGLSIKHICEKTGVGFCGFSSYLSKHHRELILKRHNLTGYADVKLRGSKGQTTLAHYRYKDAIAACESSEYIEYNISQIARIFEVDCSSLASQLRRHYPYIVPQREEERKRIGISVNLQYGARKWSSKAYGPAIELLQTSDMTIEEAAGACNVSHTGLREHILAYHPQITTERGKRRSESIGQKIRGKRNGCWGVHEPDRKAVEKYGKAIEMYRTTSMDVEEIARLAGVKLSGFRAHLRTWHPELMVHRRGFAQGTDIKETKRYKKSTAEKYADAIERLKNSSLPTSKVAAEFGFNPETFRMYVKEHYPNLAAERGMIKASNGRTVSKLSDGKYAEALHLYKNTSESLKSIAQRLGLTYNSLGGYIRRNYPEAIEEHIMRIKRYYITLIILLLSTTLAYSQQSRQLYLKTNAVGLGMAIANVAVEIDLAKHWSAALPAYYSAWDYFSETVKFRTLYIQPQIRYWLMPGNEGWFADAHFGYGFYNVATDGEYRYQDHNRETPAIGGGIAAGYRLPLGSKGKWHMEFSIGAGAYSLHYDKFRNTENGLKTGEVKKTYIGMDQASVSISYAINLKKEGGRR